MIYDDLEKIIDKECNFVIVYNLKMVKLLNGDEYLLKNHLPEKYFKLAIFEN